MCFVDPDTAGRGAATHTQRRRPNECHLPMCAVAGRKHVQMNEAIGLDQSAMATQGSWEMITNYSLFL